MILPFDSAILTIKDIVTTKQKKFKVLIEDVIYYWNSKVTSGRSLMALQPGNHSTIVPFE